MARRGSGQTSPPEISDQARSLTSRVSGRQQSPVSTRSAPQPIAPTVSRSPARNQPGATSAHRHLPSPSIRSRPPRISDVPGADVHAESSPGRWVAGVARHWFSPLQRTSETPGSPAPPRRTRRVASSPDAPILAAIATSSGRARSLRHALTSLAPRSGTAATTDPVEKSRSGRHDRLSDPSLEPPVPRPAPGTMRGISAPTGGDRSRMELVRTALRGSHPVEELVHPLSRDPFDPPGCASPLSGRSTPPLPLARTVLQAYTGMILKLRKKSDLRLSRRLITR